MSSLPVYLFDPSFPEEGNRLLFFSVRKMKKQKLTPRQYQATSGVSTDRLLTEGPGMERGSAQMLPASQRCPTLLENRAAVPIQAFLTRSVTPRGQLLTAPIYASLHLAFPHFHRKAIISNTR